MGSKQGRRGAAACEPKTECIEDVRQGRGIDDIRIDDMVDGAGFRWDWHTGMNKPRKNFGWRPHPVFRLHDAGRKLDNSAAGGVKTRSLGIQHTNDGVGHSPTPDS